jgi:lipid-A-disaccharide synthase-like uncharacterized protein
MGLPSRVFGVKWEPVAAMIGLLFVGLWLVYQPDIKARPGAYVVPVRIANERGILEAYTSPDLQGGLTTYRLTLRNGHVRDMSADELRRDFGDQVLQTVSSRPSNKLYRLFNITSWTSLAWVAIGLGGQVLFAGRTLVQWFISEKERKSVVPPVFWWMSLVGGVSLFAYFAWRQDVVGVLGQCSGVVIYARNLRLIHKHRRRDQQLAASGAGAAAAASS